ncbi:MAG: N-acetylmuramoyl-L-alanine amidase [Paludibacteraceae bacterium]|nr:N-acetylmuramoyl-L-alanine amidase [Paludibacteraceae bacterium]
MTWAIDASGKFVVVLDAGHGGHDAGALGKTGKEKDINLAVTKRVGKLIEQSCPDVKVYYTRTTDVFVTLQGRADFVNKHKADLFICIHTNSAQGPSANGAETYTLGLHKEQSNLNVAMRENSVMLLEDDYQTKYQGFNPNSVESYIMFQFMQDRYINNSLQFATEVQQNFVNAGRYNRGVRQAGFWVLHKSACPSVLIELGFISNPSEEKFLLSDAGRDKMANCIYKAFVQYKREVDKKSGKVTPSYEMPENQNENTEPSAANDAQEIEQQKSREEVPSTANDKEDLTSDTLKNDPAASSAMIDYRVQVLSSATNLTKEQIKQRGLAGAEMYQDGKVYKYTFGHYKSFAEANKARKQLAERFGDAFVVAFEGVLRIPVNDARLRQP